MPTYEIDILPTYEIDKICFDDKSYVLDGGIRTSAYFHKGSTTSCKKILKICDNWKKFWLLKKIVITETIVIIEKGYDDWKRLW